ncbi:DUF6281 family protein [Streptomyces sp. NPDC000594]|uniref:DUF6281 family protein n=1 Tax=Streptomyces sp. NPDC000594 TaxID=3154261 RepID=UPI00332D1233
MNWAGRTAGTLLAVIGVTAVGCSATGTDGGKSAAACAYQVTYDGREYRDVAEREFTVGGRLGTAVAPPCDDTDGPERDERDGTSATAYAVRGVAPEVAIAVGDTPAEAKLLVAYSGTQIPPEILKQLDRS